MSQLQTLTKVTFANRALQTPEKPKALNKYRFVFANGDVVNKETDLSIDNAILQAYVARLNTKKPANFCAIFAEDNGEWKPVVKDFVTIALKCK